MPSSVHHGWEEAVYSFASFFRVSSYASNRPLRLWIMWAADGRKLFMVSIFLLTSVIIFFRSSAMAANHLSSWQEEVMFGLYFLFVVPSQYASDRPLRLHQKSWAAGETKLRSPRVHFVYSLQLFVYQSVSKQLSICGLEQTNISLWAYSLLFCRGLQACHAFDSS